MKRLLSVLLISCLAISACGFRPLYAGQGSLGPVTGPSIAVESIPGRSGYMLRQALLRELAIGLPGLESGAILSVALDERVERATLLPDGAVSRSYYTVSGDYVLQTSAGPISGHAQSQVPFAATQSPYTDVSAQSYAAERAMEELARTIVDRLRIQAQSSR